MKLTGAILQEIAELLNESALMWEGVDDVKAEECFSMADFCTALREQREWSGTEK